MRLVGNPTIAQFDPFASEANQAEDLGARIDLADNRIFRYGKAGASNTAAGKLELAPAPKTNHHNMAVAAAAAAGVTSVSVTLGATAAVADEYDEGFLTINLTPGQGQVFRISYQPAIGSGLTGSITLQDPVITALSTASKANLVHNTHNAFVEAAVATRRAAGVGLIGLTAANFGWLQTGGVAGVLADGTIALGSLIAVSGSVAGAVLVDSGTFSTALATTQVGQASIMAGVDTEYRPMLLQIDR